MGDKAWSSEVAEHIAQATLATDRQGRIVYANPAARQQCGLTETELLSRTLGDVFRLDGGLRMMLERCLRRGESASFETEVRGGDDGAGRLVQVSVSPMRTDGTTAGLVIVASDITERRRAEAALWESQRALSTLLSNLPGMAYRCANDPDWTMEYLSEGCLALTGYPPSDLSEKRVLYNDLILPQDRRYVWDSVQQAVEAGEPFRMTYRIRARDGTVKWVWEQGRLVDRGPGRAPALEGFITDISERVHTEEALRESETRFRDIVEGADHLVTQVDGQGRYLYVNRASERILGRPVSQSIGRSAFSDVHPEDRRRTQEAFRRWREEHRESAVFENRIVSTRGEVFHILWTIMLHYDDEGGITKINSFGNDITERQRAQAELAQREAMLRGLFQGAPIGMGVVANREFLQVNDRFCQMVGYSAEELVGHGTRMLYDSQEEYERIGREVYGQSAVRGTEHTETRWRRQDGRMIDCLLSLTPLDPANLSAGVIFTAMDITDRKRAEAALRESEARLRSILLAAPIGIGLVIQRQFMMVNDQFCRMVGYDRSELLGQNSRMIYPSDEEYERVGREKYGQISAHGTGSLETQFRCRDGRVIDVVLSSTPLDESDWLAGVTFTALDITDRKRAEAALRESEARMRAVIESSPMAMVMYDLRADGALVLTGTNPAADRLTGKDGSSLIGKTIQEAFPFLSDEIAEAFRQVALTGQPRDWDELTYDNGVTRQVQEVRVFQALPGRIVVALRDITDRKRLEDQLRQAMKMEAIGRLAGGVAHDFNNQLTVIKGYTDLLLHGGASGAQVVESLEEIDRAATRAERLTSQLLAFSRRQVLRPEVLNLNGIISEMSNPLSRIIGEDIELNVVLSPNVGNVRVDRGQVEQAIMNLVINARDAMPQGGKITVETVDLVLDGEYVHQHPDAQAGPYVMLAVSDTGQGMDAATQQRIFEPFFTTKGVGKGTGLGLSMVYGFVKQSGGLIYVYSEPGRGTSFKIYLPRVSEEVSPQEADEHSASEHRGTETVLVVEDDEAVRSFLVRVLRRHGYRVEACAKSAEALALSDRHPEPIHLLVTDVVMPQMGGPELARQLQSRRAIKVLFISGYTENAIVHHGELDAGVNLLTKPFSADDLAAAVRRVLDRK